MRELLQQARRYLFLRDCVRDGLGEIDDRIYVHVDADFAVGKWALDGKDLDDVIDTCLRQLEPEEIDAIEGKLARHEWVKFTDALPVVPEGRVDVLVWVYGGTFAKPTEVIWNSAFTFEVIKKFTHWMYLDTPAPPEYL